jgi:hypothetical protein
MNKTEQNQQESILLSLITDYCNANNLIITIKEGTTIIKYHQITDSEHPSLDRFVNLYLNIYKTKKGKFIAKGSNHLIGISVDFLLLIQWNSEFKSLLRRECSEWRGKRIIEDLFLNEILM